ncbi:hypothetical protein L596_025281 [Steinernema carpocapsae]|uniref:Uncharacterized protein n=1 Tax=Steinernema carpocapsae TaxID=34508 RepID=A0A4U5M7I6_STECR|nr:hypothetical protein L596_025281 [Steinernema carpocapsae]
MSAFKAAPLFHFIQLSPLTNFFSTCYPCASSQISCRAVCTFLSLQQSPTTCEAKGPSSLQHHQSTPLDENVS